MRLFTLILTSLLSYSCSRQAELNKTGAQTELQGIKMEISHLNEIEWRIGKRKAKEVTQSITFIVDLPRVSKDDLDYLMKEKNMDAWILRLIAEKGSKQQDLGSLYAPLKPKKVSRGFPSSISCVSLKIYYAAAYASERFRSLECPAFGHDKKISDMEIQGDNESFSLLFGSTSSYPERSQEVELTPSSFNAGNTLEGTYFIEVAGYNSAQKNLVSSFKRIPMKVVVQDEEAIHLSECAGASL